MPFLIILLLILIILAAAPKSRSRYSNYKSKSKPYYRKKIYYGKKSPEKLGQEGENSVKAVIGYTQKGQKYVFNDYVILNNEKSTQIDHIVICPCGVFVIETKNYSGRIYGSENQLEWTQILAGGNEKHKLYNPLKQNATHVYCLKKILGNVPIHSVVVFVQNNTQFLQTDKVIDLKDLRKTLFFGEIVLTPSQIDSLGEKLMRNNSRGVVDNCTHVDNVKKQQRKIENNVCPRCNAPLVLKSGKYGNFWGCSNYPNCKFIKK